MKDVLCENRPAVDAVVPELFDGYRGDGGIAISIESPRDGRCRAAQGPERPGQAAVVRWKRYDVYHTAADTREMTGDITSRTDTRMTPYEKIRDMNTDKRFFHWVNKSSLALLERE